MKIKYEVDENDRSLTGCPNEMTWFLAPLWWDEVGEDMLIPVGSVKCWECKYFVGVDKMHEVVCSYKPKEEDDE